jgi:hypothetical protein
MLTAPRSLGVQRVLKALALVFLITRGTQPSPLLAQGVADPPRMETFQLVAHGLFYDYLGFQYETPLRPRFTQVWQAGVIGLGNRVRPGYHWADTRMLTDTTGESFSVDVFGKKSREWGGFLRWGPRFYPFRSDPGAFGVFLQPELGFSYAHSRGTHQYAIDWLGGRPPEQYAFQFRFHQVSAFALLNVGAQFRWRRFVWGGSAGLGLSYARTWRGLTGTYPWYVSRYFAPVGEGPGSDSRDKAINPHRRYTHLHLYLEENAPWALAASFSVTVGWLLVPRAEES